MSGTQLNNSFYRPDIDGLRALAVSFVVFYHAFPDVLKCGFIGVDIFFVISGYLIGSIILRHLAVNKFSFVQFYVRRIVRIFPVLLLVLGSVLIAGKFLLITNEYRTLGKHVAGGAGFIANIIYWSEAGYWDIGSTLKPLLHLWSLGVEEQFYIIIPLILAFIWKRNSHVLAVITVLFILSFCCNIYFYYQKQQELVFYMPFTRFWEIFAGVLLAYNTTFSINRVQVIGQKIDYGLCKVLKKNIAESKGQCFRNFFAFTGFLLLIISLQICHQNMFPGYRAVYPVLGAVLIISAGSSAWLNKKILSHKILVGIGLISYPLYLWHWPLLSFCLILGGELLEASQWILLRTACIFIAVVLAFLTYLYIERPIRFGKGNKNVKACILSVLMVGIFTAGIYVCYYGKAYYFNSQAKITHIMRRPLNIDNGIFEYLSEYSAEVKKLSYARFQNAHSTKTIAVIGDSHAQSAYHGIAEKGKELRINTVLLQYCLDPSRYDEDKLKFVLKVLQSKKDIKYVFIVLRSPLHYYFRNSELQDYQTKLQNSVDNLNNIGKKVYIVTDNPLFPYRPEIFIRNFSLVLNPNKIYITKKSAYEYLKNHFTMLDEIKEAEIINAVDVFCPHDKCSQFDENGMPLYYDTNHLSVYGSEYLTKNLLALYLEKIANEKDE